MSAVRSCVPRAEFHCPSAIKERGDQKKGPAPLGGRAAGRGAGAERGPAGAHRRGAGAGAVRAEAAMDSTVSRSDIFLNIFLFSFVTVVFMAADTVILLLLLLPKPRRLAAAVRSFFSWRIGSLPLTSLKIAENREWGFSNTE